MAATLSYLTDVFNKRPQATVSAHISPAAKFEWTPIPNSQQTLLPELQKLHWNGVRRELISIILTLKAWQQEDVKDVLLEEEPEPEIYGFETFLDQVNESSREFARQYSEQKAREMNQTSWGEYIPQERILQDIIRKLRANQDSKALKTEIREALKGHVGDDTILKRRARMLLQSAGWLDIDKFIEHRPPIDELGFWKRPTTPQLYLQKFYKDCTPLFQPLSCILCRQVIRGSFFRCIDENCVEEASRGYICQDCQHQGKHQHHKLQKKYKHCILKHSIGESISGQICKCGTVSRYDNEGKKRSLYPVRLTDRHRTTPKGTVQCGLLDLPNLVADAKFHDTVQRKDRRGSLEEENRKARIKAAQLEAQKDKNFRRHTTMETIEEKDADEDIPFFMRRITDRYPFGNVHMALRLGTIMIENGVQHTKGGAYITSRVPPNWQSSGAENQHMSAQHALALSEDRTLYSQLQDQSKPKRYKTALKQVVGGLFTGLFSSEREDEIIQLVVSGSQKNLDDEEESPRNNKKLWNSVLEPILERLTKLLTPRINIMLQMVSQQLLNLDLKLRWNQRTNNCQNFCDNLINYDTYGNLVAASSITETLEDGPLYLMSFVCRPESYQKERRVKTKYDVPSGLCEEYLLRFRYGFHLDSDIVDTLLEYWYDWGGFDTVLYHHQHLFPWDCTEAYGRSSWTCNECSIAKHVWGFPFDSWSIAELHLTRDRLSYPDVRSKQEWMKNRLTVLLAQTTLLTAAKAMAQSTNFHKKTAWIASTSRSDRLKLGGIHRAQPFSHQYEEGKFHAYFIADWAHLHQDDQVVEYETARDARRHLPDVPESSGGYGSGSGKYEPNNTYFDDFAFYEMCFYADDWDGGYSHEETLPLGEAELVGTTVEGGGDSGGGDSGGTDGGEYGGGDGGGDGGGE